MYYPQYNYFQPQQSGMIWVSGEQEAYSYLVAPNNAVALWDSAKPTIYLKQADASGKPSIKVLDYTERATSVSTPTGGVNTTYATKDDITKITAEIEAIKGKLKGADNE